MLLPWAMGILRPPELTGAKGEPVATRARPSVHRIKSSGFASDLGGRIGEWKDDRTLNLARHFTNYRFRESSANCRKTDQDCCFDLSNQVSKSDLAVGSSRLRIHDLPAGRRQPSPA